MHEPRLEHLIQNNIASIEEIRHIRDPKVRNLKMYSSLMNFVRPQTEEGNIDEILNPSFFHESVYSEKYQNNFNFDGKNHT